MGSERGTVLAMAKKKIYHTITDEDVRDALERVRAKVSGPSDAELIEDYIAGLKQIIITLRAGEDGLMPDGDTT